MKLGTALLGEGGRARRLLVSPLPGDPDRLVDLQAVEAERLRRLGEGDPEALAAALLPSSLRRLLEAGPRALARLRQTLAYAEKWARRGTLPAALAPPAAELRLLSCLPRPASLRLADGGYGDRLGLRPPEARLPWAPDLAWQATLAAAGQFGGSPAGFALVLAAGPQRVLGPWLHTGLALEGELVLETRAGTRSAPLAAWAGLTLPPLRPAELQLLPFPIWASLPVQPGDQARLQAPFDVLTARCDREGTHPTLQ